MIARLQFGAASPRFLMSAAALALTACATSEVKTAPVIADAPPVIEVVNVGARSGPPEVMAAIARGEPVDPSSYTMRTAARLESGDPAYSWVNHTLFVCAGLRHPDCVEIAYYKVTWHDPLHRPPRRHPVLAARRGGRGRSSGLGR